MRFRLNSLLMILVLGCGGAPLGAASLDEAIEFLREQGLVADEKRFQEKAVQALLKAADPLARLGSATVAERHTRVRQGELAWTGLSLVPEQAGFRITAVAPGSIGARLGIRPGGRVTAVNEESVVGTRLPQVLEKLRSLDEDKVTILIKHGEGKEEAVAVPLTRGRIPAVALAEVWTNSVGYIKVDRVVEGTGQEVESILRGWEARQLSGAMLDLRNADGDSLAAVARIAGLFARAEAGLLTTRGLDGVIRETWYAPKPPHTALTMPTLVLVNKETLGAAEALALVLREAGSGAMLVGEATQGDLALRQWSEFPGGSKAWLRFRTLEIAGQPHDGTRGVTPHVEVEDADILPAVLEPVERAHKKVDDASWRTTLALRERIGKDALLRRASDILQGLKALNIRSFRGKTP